MWSYSRCYHPFYWAGWMTVGCRLGAGWLNTEVLFTACNEMNCSWTDHFELQTVWISLRTGPTATCGRPELGLMSVCVYFTKHIFNCIFQINKNFYLPKPGLFLKSVERTHLSLVNTALVKYVHFPLYSHECFLFNCTTAAINWAEGLFWI